MMDLERTGYREVDDDAAMDDTLDGEDFFLDDGSLDPFDDVAELSALSPDWIRSNDRFE